VLARRIGSSFVQEHLLFPQYPSIKQQEEASHTISSVMIPEHNMVSFVSDKRNMCVSQNDIHEKKAITDNMDYLHFSSQFE
jgi:hypothetical protein